MRRARAIVLGIAGVVLLGLAWEGYKLVGPAGGFDVTGESFQPITVTLNEGGQ